MTAAGYTTHAAPTDPESVQGVERLLGILNLLPAEEPPVGLVERTLARCERGVAESAADHMPFRMPAGLDSIPHA